MHILCINRVITFVFDEKTNLYLLSYTNMDVHRYTHELRRSVYWLIWKFTGVDFFVYKKKDLFFRVSKCLLSPFRENSNASIGTKDPSSLTKLLCHLPRVFFFIILSHMLFIFQIKIHAYEFLDCHHQNDNNFYML